MHRNSTFAFIASATTLAAVLASTATANHGPGTSGGGINTFSGETMKASTWDMSFRLDYTSFDGLTEAQAASHAASSGAFDSIDSATITTFGLSYGVTEDIQVGTTIGWYWGSNFIDAMDTGAGIETAFADPSGLTDMWITGKFRIVKGQPGNVSLLAGIKLPTGKTDCLLSNGEPLEPSSQPGTGAVDFMTGVAYSRFLDAHITIDASAAYTFRTEHDDFKVGDRFDAGVALAYRLTDDINSFPNISVFGEVAYTQIWKDQEGGVANPNSGGETLYLAPGVRVRFNPTMSLTVSPAFPVWQNLDGDQVEMKYKVSAMMSIAF